LRRKVEFPELIEAVQSCCRIGRTATKARTDRDIFAQRNMGAVRGIGGCLQRMCCLQHKVIFERTSGGFELTANG